jgi:hypothetical protein
MLTRRSFLGYSALAPAMLAYRPLLRSAAAQAASASSAPPVRLAIIGSTYRYGSALQTIADRFLVGYPRNGDWHIPNVQVVSMYVELRARAAQGGSGEQQALGMQSVQRSPEDRRAAVAQSVQPPSLTEGTPAATAAEDRSDSLADLSAMRSREFGFRLCSNIPEALRCGGDGLLVDAVLSVVEQGDYPRNDKHQILYPRYDFFEQCAQVFEEEGRAVPYFNHESLSFSFHEAQSMIATAERLKFPLLAGSSLPVTWRLPDIDMPLGAKIQEAVMVGVGNFDGDDFDALEAMQSMLERRKSGETGVKAVQLLEGDDVWAAGDCGRWSKELLSSALSRSDAPLGLTLLDGRPQDMVASGVLPQLAKDPAAYCIEYNDETRATLLMLNGADQDFTFSARVEGHELIATQFFRSPAPNLTYSACLAAKIEEMFVTGTAPYPVQRTLLTGGILEAALTSKARLNQRLETPHLAVRYEPCPESQYART